MLLLVLFFAPKKRTELRDLGGKPPAGVDVIVQGNALLKGVWGYPPDGMQGNALQKETILF